MTVVLTEQIKLTFPSKKERIFADQAFSKVTKKYADACTSMYPNTSSGTGVWVLLKACRVCCTRMYDLCLD